MSIFDRFQTGVRAKVRTGRHGDQAIRWSDPIEVPLHLQKDSSGACCLVALQGVDFAEFDPRYNHESASLLVTEDYALEVLELPIGMPV